MAETYGLSVVHIEPVRRIARRVAQSPVAGRYFAVGSSAELRRKVATAFEAVLGADNVVTIDLSASPQDPWNQVRALQLTSARATRGVLYIVFGLSGVTTAGGEHPYAQLNLSRDAWGSTGTHLLVWVEGLDEFDRFLTAAPDLWSHRDVVGWFLSLADFEVEGGEISESETLLARERAALKVLEREGLGDGVRAQACLDLAWVYIDQGRPLRSWERLLEAERLVKRSGDQGSTEVERCATYTLVRLNRWHDGSRRARAALRRWGPEGAWRENQLTEDLATSLAHHRGEAGPLHASLWSTRRRVDSADLVDRVWTNYLRYTFGIGRIRAALTLLRQKPLAGEDDDAWWSTLQTWQADAAGDGMELLRHQHRAARAFAAVGKRGLMGNMRTKAAETLDDFGLWGEAAALYLEVAQADTDGLRTPAASWGLHWRRSDPNAAVALASLVTAAKTLAASWPGRGLALAMWDNLLDTLDSHALPTDPAIATIEQALRDCRAVARADKDPEAEGWVTWLLARVALLREDRPRAFGLADNTLVRWCRRWRGPSLEIDIWRFLADCAPLGRASDFARRAVELADADPSIYAQIDARRTFAKVAVRTGQLSDAVAALDAALGLARLEGLRPRELLLLHELAELPGHAGAHAAAEAALTLASSMMMPREEARALLTLALTAPAGASGSLAHRRLERAQEIAAELGPPKLAARVGERIRLNSPAGAFGTTPHVGEDIPPRLRRSRADQTGLHSLVVRLAERVGQRARIDAIR